MPYVACENYNFVWDEKQVNDVIYLWKEGLPLEDIANYVKRKQMEVAILVMDLAEQNRLLPRKGGIHGEVAE